MHTHRLGDLVPGRGAVEAATPDRGPGQDRRDGRVASGTVVAAGRDRHGARALDRAGDRAGSGPCPGGQPGSADGSTASTVEAAAAARDHLRRQTRVDRRARHLVATAPLRASRSAGRVRRGLRGGAAGQRPQGPARQADRGDGGDQRVRGHGATAGLSTGRVDVDRIRIGSRDRRLEPFTGSSIGAFLGLVPSEYSSGQSRVQGSITKTGNTHARRLLVEAAWHHRKPYRPGAVMQARWAHASGMAVARGDAGNHRLHRKWQQFTARKKRPVIANVAIARELAGRCWSLAVMPD